jgi:hypothetical protein
MYGKSQILFGWPIRPPKNPNLFKPANQASKNCNFVQISLKNNNFAPRSATLNHSASILSTSPTLPWPILRAATIALTALNISWSFPHSSLKIWGCVSFFGHPGWVPLLQSGIGLMEAGSMLTCSVAFHWCIVRKLQWYLPIFTMVQKTNKNKMSSGTFGYL